MAASGVSGIWEKLPPDEFKKLQEYTRYSQKKLKDVVSEFREGLHPDYDLEQPMSYYGFKLFMSSYLGNYISDELIQTLFYTFHKNVCKPNVDSPELPNALLKKFQNENGKISSESLDDSTLSRIAKGTRRATVVATATVVAVIQPNKEMHGSLLDVDKRAQHTSPKRGDGKGQVNKSDLSVNHIRGNTDQLAEDFQDTGEEEGTRFYPMIEIKEVACYLSLLEGGDVQDKLEFVFRVYDSDNNNYLDQQELESIVAQMIHVAEYLGWDTHALKPILTDMLADMDFDADGTISMDEWIKGGMNNIPFLVLLGLDVKVGEEGKHQWQMKHFVQAYCNICQIGLEGFGRKQGLQCTFCRYTCHERCVNRVPDSCIQTYTKNRSRRKITTMDHQWVEGNCPGKCSKCSKKIKNNCLTGLHCVWCQAQVHNRCVQQMPKECTLGKHRVHVLPPICIMPQTGDKEKDRKPNKEQQEKKSKKKNSVISYDGIPMLISPLPHTRPLIIFVNPKSGGRQGARLLGKFLYLLNPRQVFNLAEGGPLPGLKFFSQVPDFRVLCCGGDGTAGWVLSTIDRLTSIRQRPAMAILPLGTGNDLSRCLGWGGGYDGGSIDKHLCRIEKSTVAMMDRWEIGCELTDKNCEEGDSIPQSIINNYFSIGVDASVALKFHLQREKNPEKFNSRFKNKLRYFEAGTSEQMAASCKNMQRDIEMVCDGKKIDLPSLEGIAILNIPSIYGGAHIWGEPEKKKRGSSKDDNDLSTCGQDMGDKKLEVVGLENSMNVGQIVAGLKHGMRLAQCSKITIRVTKTLPMQVDGEPWMQAPAEITITHKNQTPMLVAPPHSKGGLFRFRRNNNCDKEESEPQE